MRQWQLGQRGKIIRHLPCQVIFFPSPAKALNLVESIVCNDALLTVLALSHRPSCQSDPSIGYLRTALRLFQSLPKLGQAGTTERYRKELGQGRLLAARRQQLLHPLEDLRRGSKS